MIYSLIENSEELFPIEKMCKVLQVTSESYYRWKKQTITVRQQRKIAIKEKIILIYYEFKQGYESLRIIFELHSFGYKILRPESFARTGEAISLTKIYETAKFTK